MFPPENDVAGQPLEFVVEIVGEKIDALVGALDAAAAPKVVVRGFKGPQGGELRSAVARALASIEDDVR